MADNIISLFLVVAGVAVIVLGFFKNFGGQIQKIRVEKYGINAELSTMGLWLVLGFLLSASGAYVYLHPASSATDKGPTRIKLNVNFDPDKVNPRNPDFKVTAFMKVMGKEQTEEKSLPVRSTVEEGSVAIEVQVPDRETPFYVRFSTPQGTWKTDDHSAAKGKAMAYQIVGQ